MRNRGKQRPNIMGWSRSVNGEHHNMQRVSLWVMLNLCWKWSSPARKERDRLNSNPWFISRNWSACGMDHYPSLLEDKRKGIEIRAAAARFDTLLIEITKVFYDISIFYNIKIEVLICHHEEVSIILWLTSSHSILSQKVNFTV